MVVRVIAGGFGKVDGDIVRTNTKDREVMHAKVYPFYTFNYVNSFSNVRIPLPEKR